MPRPPAIPSVLALLRGINVGPGRAVPMADLRTLAGDLGWTSVRSYIQSGNLIFHLPDGTPEGVSDLASRLEAALATRYPFPIPVLVRTADQWRELAADRPFGGWSDPKQLSVSLLSGIPNPATWAALAPWSEEDDAIELVGDRVWVKTPTAGYGNTKFTNAWLEKKLGLRATTRNRATIDALLGLVSTRPVDETS